MNYERSGAKQWKQQAARNCAMILCVALCMAGLSVSANAKDAFVPPSSDGWKSLQKMPQKRTLAAAASINGIVYVAGGIDKNPDRSLFAYDMATKTWATLADMPARRYDGNGAAAINGKLYVAGGWTRHPPFPHASLFVYDRPSNTWSKKAPMSHPSACGATGAISGKLYVLTGCDGENGYSREFDVYDPSTDSWSSLPVSVQFARQSRLWSCWRCTGRGGRT
jgi:N-acetylneuraminic acid mutarotase